MVGIQITQRFVMMMNEPRINPLLAEYKAVQNEGLGALLIWRLTYGYSPPEGQFTPTPLSVAFLCLPLVLNERTRKAIQSTNKSSGLRAVADKLTRAELVSIHGRMLSNREASWQAVRLGLHTGLIALGHETASVWPMNVNKAPKSPNSIEAMVKQAEKLGLWFSKLTLYEISRILKVDF